MRLSMGGLSDLLRLGVSCSVLLLSALAAAPPAGSVILGQIDDFQDGTTQGWGSGVGNPNPPVNVSDVGPAGVGDSSLQITSTGGFGPGSRLVAFSFFQWAGDYTSAGVDLIVADVNNVGSTALDLRLAIDGSGGQFASSVAVPLAPGSGWQTIGLPISPADLTSVGGFDVNATLASAVQLRLLSAASPSFMGDPIVAELLVDNIVAVPEPSPMLLTAGFAALLFGARWRARAKRT